MMPQNTSRIVWIPVPREGLGPASQPPWFRQQKMRPIGFLDLPASVRSKIYEELGQASRRTTTVTVWRDEYMKFDAVSVPLSILRTCRAVHLEAFPIFQRCIQRIMARAPRIYLPIEVALAMFPAPNSSGPFQDILETIINGVGLGSLRLLAIHSYRISDYSPSDLAMALNLPHMLDDNDQLRPEKLEVLNALASFVLLAAKYIEHFTLRQVFL